MKAYNDTFNMYIIVNSSILSILYYSNDFNAFLLYLIFFILYASIYLWRRLPFTFLSFVCFFINYSFLCLFVYGIYNIYIIGIIKPIYVENITVYTYYRYMASLIITLIGIFVYLLVKFYPSGSSFVSIIGYPYLKEEMRIILYTWNDRFMGSSCSFIIDLLFSSIRFRIIFIIVHFILFYTVQCLQTLFFFNFVFLHGDLRWNLYLLPFSFFYIVYQYFYYYWITFVKQSAEYLRDIIKVTPKSEMPNKFVLVDVSDLTFEVFPSKDYDDDSLTWLIPLWLKLQSCIVLCEKYSLYFSYLSYFISFLRIISLSFVFTNDSISLGKEQFLLLTRTRYTCTRSYATENFLIKKAKQAALEIELNPLYKKNHMITTDTAAETDGKVPFINQPTHGTGSVNNPSEPMNSLHDVKGNPVAQRAVYPKIHTWINKDYLDKAVPNSTNYQTLNEVRQNQTKYGPKPKSVDTPLDNDN